MKLRKVARISSVEAMMSLVLWDIYRSRRSEKVFVQTEKIVRKAPRDISEGLGLGEKLERAPKG